MATRQLLAERVAAFIAASGSAVDMLAIAGVEAARRIERGEAFDVVVLASEAIDRLAVAERLAPGQRLDWVRSKVAVAVAAGAARPDISTAAAVRQAAQRAARIGYSTGPSGVAVEALFRSWGLADEFRSKGVKAPPGVPVAAMVARAEVDLGFQQLSEMQHEPGVDVLGLLPAEMEIVTTFTAAVCRTTTEPALAKAFLRHLADPMSADSVRRHGMELA